MAFGKGTGGSGDLGGGSGKGDIDVGTGGDTGGWTDPTQGGQVTPGTDKMYWRGYLDGVLVYDESASRPFENARADMVHLAMLKATANKGVIVSWELWTATDTNPKVSKWAGGSDKVDAEVKVLPDTSTGGESGGASSGRSPWLGLIVIVIIIIAVLYFLPKIGPSKEIIAPIKEAV